ncbi:FAD-dependent monooxygenase [Nocardia otitidiscaviarum]|uniref:FAD-dependent oxidoreductase n=1 Tax=Nocardia otitidiscaviarum TaxID=1823 RepID=UPI0004A77510|nr:FAD-dependent monooxygenase [Nocardia otitidiscaviarum]MBF6489019.1 FAD-dependent monooxygenase [Nocardia otitidiscaviarum]
MSANCVVVGAGPVGLAGALALARRGVAVTVVEAEGMGRMRPGSRAIGLFGPTVRRFDAVLPGLGEAVAAAGIRVRGYDAYYGERRVFGYRSRRGVLGRVMPSELLGVSLPQTVTENHLYEACVAHGVRFRWASPLMRLTSGPDGVEIELETGDTLSAAYVIGADGARSRVRDEIGATLRGTPDDTRFVIVDVADHPDGTTPHMPGFFQYNCPRLGGRNVMHMPFQGGMRIDLQCLPGDDADYWSGLDGIRRWTAEIVDPWYGEHVTWVSSYRFHQSVADTYTDPHRRVLLAGEAAHLFAPWGGRGLNSGVFDATDAATAIAHALRTPDPHRARRAIERVACHRRAWGIRNRDLSSRALRIMRAAEPTTLRVRDRAARLAPVCWPAGAWLANAPLQVAPPPVGLRGLY